MAGQPHKLIPFPYRASIRQHETQCRVPTTVCPKVGLFNTAFRETSLQPAVRVGSNNSCSNENDVWEPQSLHPSVCKKELYLSMSIGSLKRRSSSHAYTGRTMAMYADCIGSGHDSMSCLAHSGSIEFSKKNHQHGPSSNISSVGSLIASVGSLIADPQEHRESQQTREHTRYKKLQRDERVLPHDEQHDITRRLVY